jgi:hypothetical protein
MLKTNAELAALSINDPDSVDIYKKGPIDRYSDRPDELENICLADFIALYTFKTKKGRTAADENDDEVQDVVEELDMLDIDDNIAETVLKKTYELKNQSGSITLRRRPKIIRYCRFNIHQDEVNYFREMCLLFLPWRDEDNEIEAQDCAEKFKQNEELVKKNYDKFNAVTLDIDEISRQIQNDRNEDDLDDELNGQSEFVDPNFHNVYDFDDTIIQPNATIEMGLEAPGSDVSVSKYTVPNMMTDNEYYALCDSLNSLQRDYLMHVISSFKSSDVPIYHFLSGKAGVGKSRLIHAIYYYYYYYYLFCFSCKEKPKEA